MTTKTMADQQQLHQQSTIDDDVNQFLGTFLSLNASECFNCENYDYENYIIDQMKRRGIEFLSSSSSSSSTAIKRNQYQPKEFPIEYKSLLQYKQFYLPHIILDSWAQIVDHYYNYSASYKQLSNLNLCQIYDDKKYNNEFSYITLTLKALVPSNAVRADKFSLENWIILLLLSYDNVVKDKTRKIFGFITSYAKLETYLNHDSAPQHLIILGYNDDDNKSLTTVEYTVKVFKCQNNINLLNQNNNQKISIKPLYYFRPQIRYIETLSLMEFWPNFVETFLQPNEKIFRVNIKNPTSSSKSSLMLSSFVSSDGNEVFFDNNFHLFEDHLFNQQQKEAILACVNALRKPYSRNKVVMIQGPPGTGKF